MDSQADTEGQLLDIVDDAWRENQLPSDDINVPSAELPDPEADNGDFHDTEGARAEVDRSCFRNPK